MARLPERGSVSFPVIVKPQFGDGSDEIGKGALVHTEQELLRRVESVRRRTREPLMCEQFIAGRDLFVGAPRQCAASDAGARARGRAVTGRRAPRFATSRVKNDARYRTKWRIRYREAKLAAGGHATRSRGEPQDLSRAEAARLRPRRLSPHRPRTSSCFSKRIRIPTLRGTPSGASAVLPVSRIPS